jgi:hypothetical protein
MLRAHDCKTNQSDSALIKALQEKNPPYIFGTDDDIKLGDTFMIGEFVFVVTRWATKEEYIAFMPDNYKYAEYTKTFFEGATD